MLTLLLKTNFTETFTVTAYAVYHGNSTLTTYALSSPSTLPVIYVDPPEILGLPPSSTFTISVKISNVTNLYGFDLTIPLGSKSPRVY